MLLMLILNIKIRFIKDILIYINCLNIIKIYKSREWEREKLIKIYFK